MTRRITVVASELLGRAGTGGAGTADSLLAVALGRLGHDVQLLVASGREIGALRDEWSRTYESAGVDVRVLEQREDVSPSYLVPAYEVYEALRRAAPDVAIINDWRGLGYVSLRARQARRALTETAFVVHCHGAGRVLTTFAQKVPDTVERFGEQVMERGSLELADAVVSPTRWLLDWMRARRWPVPDHARVIPYLRHSAALGVQPAPAAAGVPIARIAFFGQLREGKGIRLLLAALGSLDARLLVGKEILFLGSARGRWARHRVAEALPPHVAENAAGVRLETDLDHDAAIAELRRPGTLAVMPSLLDNAPNTVSECIENGIPFVSTATGGIPELVAEEDHPRVLCAPTVGALTDALGRALAGDPPFAPARAATAPEAAVDAWLELVDAVRPPRITDRRPPSRVAIVAVGSETATRARGLEETTRSVELEVVEADSRSSGLFRTSTEWILFLDDDDEPEGGLIDALVAAQTASGADVVTCAVRSAGEIRLFLGDPGSLGIVENQYGVVALVRSSLVIAGELPERGVDPDWPLLARLALSGATIVSIPDVLVQQTGAPGRVADIPGEGLEVLETFEQADAGPNDLPQLAATLAAELVHTRVEAARDGRPTEQRTRRRLASLVRATLSRR